MENGLIYTFHTPGAAAANHAYRFIAPNDLQLIHVSAVGSNTNNATFTIGSSTSAAAYLAASDVGDAAVPSEFDRDDFVGGEFPHIAKGVTICLLYTYNTGGTNANVTLILTCTEG